MICCTREGGRVNKNKVEMFGYDGVALLRTVCIENGGEVMHFGIRLTACRLGLQPCNDSCFTMTLCGKLFLRTAQCIRVSMDICTTCHMSPIHRPNPTSKSCTGAAQMVATTYNEELACTAQLSRQPCLRPH